MRYLYRGEKLQWGCCQNVVNSAEQNNSQEQKYLILRVLVLLLCTLIHPARKNHEVVFTTIHTQVGAAVKMFQGPTHPAKILGENVAQALRSVRRAEKLVEEAS